jgi:hypothetical protein
LITHLQDIEYLLTKRENLIFKATELKASLVHHGKVSEIKDIQESVKALTLKIETLITEYRDMRKIKLDRDTLLDPNNVLNLALIYGADFIRDLAHDFAFSYAPNVKDLKYPESKVKEMTDKEYEANREEILKEMEKFRPESENLSVERSIHRENQSFSYDPKRAEMLKGIIGAEGVLREMGLEGYETFNHTLFRSINPQIKINVQSKASDNNAGSMRDLVLS